MMRHYTIIIFLILNLDSFGQYFINQEGVKQFEYGSKFLELGDYYNADSCFSLALCSFRNENVYFNRALSRIMQNDTIGFCSDLEVAIFPYLDAQAASMFNEFCCIKVDSMYYKRKFVAVTKDEKHRYFEELRYKKYSNEHLGIIHDLKSKDVSLIITNSGCDNQFAGLMDKTTDIIAVYKLINETKYFYLCTNPPEITSTINSKKYKERTINFIKGKYRQLKEENEIEELIIAYELTINKGGYFADLKITRTIPEIDLSEIKDSLEIDLLKLLRKDIKVRPAKYRGIKVNYISNMYIEY